MKKEHYTHYTHLVKVFNDTISYIKTIENWHSYYVAERILNNQSLDYESPIRGLPEDYADDIKKLSIEKREEAHRLLYEKRDYLNAKDRQKSQPLQDVAEPLHELEDLLPKELRSDEATAYFNKAIELGLMDDEYQWKKGLQLLSSFAREMSLKLGLNKAMNSDGTHRISWKPFEHLFNVQKGKLRSNYADIQKIGKDPSEAHLIDEVFR